MSLYLEHFARSLPPGVHAILVLDQAGWHLANNLEIPDNLTLVRLPPYSPELNPVERVWLYLWARWLSHRLFADCTAIIEACCEAWNGLCAEPGASPPSPTIHTLGRSRLSDAGISRERARSA